MEELYRKIGSLIQIVQYIEYNLVEVARLRRILTIFDNKSSVPNKVFEQAESEADDLREKLSNKTMGTVIKTIKNFYVLNASQTEELEEILGKRNDLVHHFFKENDFEEQAKNYSFMINRKGYLGNFLTQAEKYNSFLVDLIDQLQEEYDDIE
ncbi:hypothetical protein CI105_08540 [Candidatus Izimaplasma bacterium ZiA1]|uniref:hypothetical protein n=1 Tax=Candidatus Izimoplasma sp. ZiA1 TaxID=2024899 RepID=UPI000BAA5C4E|nr:hypothetical protein CI105_08540 [Candidatus Izimaplasma bacterium ZiA1]